MERGVVKREPIRNSISDSFSISKGQVFLESYALVFGCLGQKQHSGSHKDKSGFLGFTNRSHPSFLLTENTIFNHEAKTFPTTSSHFR